LQLHPHLSTSLPEKYLKGFMLQEYCIAPSLITMLFDILSQEQEAIVDTKFKETTPSLNSDPFQPQISQDIWTQESLTSATYFHELYPA